MEKIATFDDWIDLFRKWQKDIGVDPALLKDYPFEAFYEPSHSSEIEFGEYAGQKKWERLLQVPTQEMRDALMHLIVYQGDTEFASSEQQRGLIDKAPSDYDLKCLLRVMREEMRHGWQMSHILVKHFGDSGKLEARKLLERRAYEHTRLLGAFNEPVDHWLDFFTYTAFIDRDGKYQLTMLSHSGFAPLADSMGPMLKEESFHLFTGQSGLTRVVKAGKIPIRIVQKYFNKWLSTGYDLFGKDRSSSVLRFYRWGLKGRFDEDQQTEAPKDLERLNEEARSLYIKEVAEIISGLNRLIPEGEPKLFAPDVKFNRKIGDYADKTYSVDGKLLSADQYRKHLAEVLPGPQDTKILETIFKEGNWLLSGNGSL
ncbi:MAG TPA: Phenylacetic acid catabolic protein [Candidatus Acidoferrales bacterium]|nr:Phenylacetic acid catabolic protein [Candidatus Acidoferrales bacterium]